MKRDFAFRVHGPFDLDLHFSGKAVLFDERAAWEHMTPDVLSRLTGCYVFALRSGKGNLTPHYVGLTKRSFASEVFNRSNIRKYRHAMKAHRRHRPVLFLVAHPDAKGKRNGIYIDELERFLIEIASTQNPGIRNVKGVRKYKWRIEGVTARRPGKPPAAARRFLTTMGIRLP